MFWRTCVFQIIASSIAGLSWGSRKYSDAFWSTRDSRESSQSSCQDSRATPWPKKGCRVEWGWVGWYKTQIDSQHCRYMSRHRHTESSLLGDVVWLGWLLQVQWSLCSKLFVSNLATGSIVLRPTSTASCRDLDLTVKPKQSSYMSWNVQPVSDFVCHAGWVCWTFTGWRGVVSKFWKQIHVQFEVSKIWTVDWLSDCYQKYPAVTMLQCHSFDF